MVLRWRQHMSAPVRASRSLHRCHPHPSPPPSKGEGKILQLHGNPLPPCGGGLGWGVATRSMPAWIAAYETKAGERGSRPRSGARRRSEEHTSELQSLMRNASAVFCLKQYKDRRQTQAVMLNQVDETNAD